ncbi:MAG TPA: hypothetical protein VIJ14_04125 [Rhabdochlamydiaceae bacterium]
MKGMVYNLRDKGITNYSSEDYGSIASGKTKELIAHCTSNFCTRVSKGKKNVFNNKTKEQIQYEDFEFKQYAIKKVSRRLDDCPDCGHRLLWKWQVVR